MCGILGNALVHQVSAWFPSPIFLTLWGRPGFDGGAWSEGCVPRTPVAS